MIALLIFFRGRKMNQGHMKKAMKQLYKQEISSQHTKKKLLKNRNEFISQPFFIFLSDALALIRFILFDKLIT